MSGKQTKKLAVLVKKENIEKAGKKYVHLEYYYPDNPSKVYPEDRPYSFVKDSPTFAEKLKTTKVGDTICLLKQENVTTYNGQQRSFWNTIEILDKSEAPPPWKGGQNKVGGSGFDSVGQRVGQVCNKTVDMAVAQKKFTTEGLTAIADQLIALSMYVDAKLRTVPTGNNLSPVDSGTPTRDKTSHTEEQVAAPEKSLEDDLDLDLE